MGTRSFPPSHVPCYGTTDRESGEAMGMQALALLPATGSDIPVPLLWVGGGLVAAGLVVLLVLLLRRRGGDTAESAAADE